MNDSKLPFQQAQIRIVYGIEEDGQQAVAITYEADGVEGSVPDYFTGLVMFEVAKLNFLRRHRAMGSAED